MYSFHIQNESAGPTPSNLGTKYQKECKFCFEKKFNQTICPS